MSELTLKPVQPQASSSKPTPTRSLLKPWEFEYRPSPDGKDLNLLIMFHGLGKFHFGSFLVIQSKAERTLKVEIGDTCGPFSKLGESLNLPSTAVLSLQAPDQ